MEVALSSLFALVAKRQSTFTRRFRIIRSWERMVSMPSTPTRRAEAQAAVRQNRATAKATESLPEATAAKEGRRPQPGARVTPEAAGGQGEPTPAPAPAPERVPPDLPTAKARSGASLEEKTVLIYGPHGIGKSTLASEWAGGEVFFFDCAGELNDIEVYSQRIGSWTEFKEYCWALEKNPGQFKAACIDTVDMLGVYCAQAMRKKLGIVHESDAEWGKGWTAVKEEFAATIAKLANLPGLGLLLVGHSKEVEIKTRSSTYNKLVPTLTGGVKEVCVNLPDLILHVDWSDEDERVIHTKPSPYWEAKERGRTPRLPAEIAWPLGESGYAILKEAWNGPTEES